MGHLSILGHLAVWSFVLSNGAVIDQRGTYEQERTPTPSPILQSLSPSIVSNISAAYASDTPRIHPGAGISTQHGDYSVSLEASPKASEISSIEAPKLRQELRRFTVPINQIGPIGLVARSDTDSLPLVPTITPSTVIGGLILMAGGGTLAVVGVRRRLIQIYISTGFLTAISITLLIDYVMKPPISNLIQGAYLVAVVLVGAILGSAALLLRDFTEGLGCLLGGFCISMWVLTLQPSGTIQNTGGKAIFMSMLSIVCWTLSFSRHTRQYAIIGLTSFAGSTGFVLGLDSFTRAGLKEFWLYIWNLNPALFPISTFSYPITKGMRVETVVIPILCIMGSVAQLRLWQVIRDRKNAKRAVQQAEARQRETIDELHGLYLEQDAQGSRTYWEKTYDTRHESRQSLISGASNPTPKRATSVSFYGSESERQRKSGNGYHNSWARTRHSVAAGDSIQSVADVDEITVSRTLSSRSTTSTQNRDGYHPTASLESIEESPAEIRSLHSRGTLNSLSAIEPPSGEGVSSGPTEIPFSGPSPTERNDTHSRAGLPVKGLDQTSMKDISAERSNTSSPLAQELEFDPEELRRDATVSELPPSDIPQPEDSPSASEVERFAGLEPSEPSKSLTSTDEQASQDIKELRDLSLAPSSKPKLYRTSSIPSPPVESNKPRIVRRSTGPHGMQMPHPIVARLSASSQSLRSPYRNPNRNSSLPTFSQDLVQSPIKEDKEAIFFPQDQQRNLMPTPASEIDLRRLSALRSLSAPLLPTRPPPVASQSTPNLARPQIKVSSADSDSVRTVNMSTTSYGKRPATPQSSTHVSHDSRIRTSVQPPVKAVDRDATLAELRASIRRESTVLAQSQSKLDLRRAEMLQEKQWAKTSQQQQQVVKDHRDIRLENAMRSSDMQALHRDAMRKMQAKANQHV